MLAGLRSPKEEYNEMLNKLLVELKENRGISEYRARLMISGAGGCDNPGYYDIIEEVGGLVVADSLWKPVLLETCGIHERFDA